MSGDAMREALAALRFNWSETPDHIWSTSPYHVDGLHERAEQEIRSGINDANWSEGPSPIGLVLQGQKGVGKTHLLGWVRREVQRQQGYFFLITLSSGDTFWADAADALLTGLSHTDDSGETQLALFLRRLCDWTGTPESVTRAVTGDAPLTVEDLDVFLAGLRRLDARAGRECADTARALALCLSANAAVGEDYLAGKDTQDENARLAWGIRRGAKPAHQVVQEVSTLLALTGPSVMAVDQFDTLVAAATQTPGNAVADPKVRAEVTLVADGLMMLRQRTKRTLSIVACLPTTWQLLRTIAIDSVQDRFHEPLNIGRITDPERARAFVEAWLTVPYRRIGFDPPHPTWPIAPAAFDDWDEYSAREVLKRVRGHADACLKGTIRELTSFDTDQQAITTEFAATGHESETFAELDARFAELKAAVKVHEAKDERTEDEVMPGYLSAALRAWITETGNDDMTWEVETPSDTKVLHACLNRVVDEKLDVEEHWAFRAIAATNARAALSRLQKAVDAAGSWAGSDEKHLVILREPEWSRGEKTQAALRSLRAGGRDLTISDDDLRTFGALEEMLKSQSFELLEWLVARQPASNSALLREILPATTPEPPAGDPAAIQLGSVALDLETLRKHVVIFAGSGSGKTVLMRRIVEECALRGVSAIVLDSNNDLARLGDPWPNPPAGWGPDDPRLAEEYLANTDVVVWTPGRAGGRPLSFQPLPDFASVLDDEDELNQSVEAAVATLAPHGGVDGATDKANRGKAVLREALGHYARSGARSLPGFVELLADLPDGVSRLASGQKIAAGLAETLTAAMVNNPLLGGMGEPVDPAVLLTPAPGRKARISVISFIGLPAEEQRQGFVNQLQMEVFAWFKRNPSRDLGGLLVMDEAQMLAPAQKSTASLYSTIVLASQARKYGLGLLFATQAPRGLHNQVTGNATTQFVGRLQHATQIAAVQDIARTQGGRLDDVGGLGVGQFYATSEQFAFRLVTSPLCLSHHPPSPLRDEEVLRRARNGG